MFIRKATNRSFGGTELGRSFLLEYDDQYNKFVKIEDLYLFLVVVHEMVHVWPGMELRNGVAIDKVPWFNEGIATYYMAVLPYQFGRIDRQQFLSEINKIASAYYTSSVAHMSDKEALKKEYSDVNCSRLP